MTDALQLDANMGYADVRALNEEHNLKIAIKDCDAYDSMHPSEVQLGKLIKFLKEEYPQSKAIEQCQEYGNKNFGW